MTIAAILIAGIGLGFLAAFIMRQKSLGMVGYMLVGLAGAFVGGFFFGSRLSITEAIFINALVASAIGAVIFLLGIGLFKRTEVRSGQV